MLSVCIADELVRYQVQPFALFAARYHLIRSCYCYDLHSVYTASDNTNAYSLGASTLHTLGLFVVFPSVFLSSRVTGACPVTTDLIMRVNVRTTTTTTTTTTTLLLLLCMDRVDRGASLHCIFHALLCVWGGASCNKGKGSTSCCCCCCCCCCSHINSCQKSGVRGHTRVCDTLVNSSDDVTALGRPFFPTVLAFVSPPEV